MVKPGETSQARTHGLYARTKSAVDIRADKARRLLRKFEELPPWLESAERIATIPRWCERRRINLIDVMHAEWPETSSGTTIEPGVAAVIRLVEGEAVRLRWARDTLWNARFWLVPQGLASVRELGERIGIVTTDFTEFVTQQCETAGAFLPIARVSCAALPPGLPVGGSISRAGRPRPPK